MAGGRNRRERGVALVTVMALIASIGVLVASAVAISQYSAAETDTFASLQRSALEAESAANRTLCLLLADRAKNADRRLGAETDGTAERFLADGTEHTVTAGGRTVSVRIFDAVAGLDLAGRNPARQLTNQDYDKYDLLIGMDSANLRNMHRICGGDFAGKLRLLMDYTDHPRDVADPWYAGDFEATWQDVLSGCQGLLRELLQERGEQNG